MDVNLRHVVVLLSKRLEPLQLPLNQSLELSNKEPANAPKKRGQTEFLLVFAKLTDLKQLPVSQSVSGVIAAAANFASQEIQPVGWILSSKLS